MPHDPATLQAIAALLKWPAPRYTRVANASRLQPAFESPDAIDRLKSNPC